MKDLNQMKPAFCLLLALAAATAFAITRTVEVSAYDADSNEVTLEIGAGAGTSDDVKYLFVGYDSADRGTDPEDWSMVDYLRTVYASTTNETITCSLPEEMQSDSGVMRFFLQAPKDRRWQEGAYLHSHGKGVMTNLVNGSHLLYVDTGIVPDINTEITIETLVYNYNYNAPFGVYGYCYLFSTGQADSVLDFFGNFKRVGKFNPSGDDGVHLIKLGKNGAYVDGVCVAGPWTRFSGVTKAPIYLFARNNPSESAEVTESTDEEGVLSIINNFKMGHCYIYSAQIVTNGVLARSFTPRQVDGDNVLWDSVTETAFGNAAPGSSEKFGYGTTEVTLDKGTNETCSAARKMTHTFSGLTVDPVAGKVVLTFGGDNLGGALYAVRGAEDLGADSDPSAWDHQHLIGKVAAGAATYEAVLPEEWWQEKGYLRFILAGTPYYDWKIESLSSTGKGSYTDSANNGSTDQGYQYILTGVVPDTNTTTTLDIVMPDKIDMVPMGIQSRYATFYNPGKYYYTFFGNDGGIAYSEDNTIPTSSGGNRHVLSIGPGGAIADGKVFAEFTSMSRTTDCQIPLFARLKNDWATYEKFGPCTMYSVQIEQNGSLVRDYIPVARDGVGYLFDRVTKTLYGNANTTYGTAQTDAGPAPFVMGDPVVELTSNDVLAISGRVVLSRGFVLVVR